MGTRDEERAQQVVAVERFNGNVIAIQLENGKRVPAHVGYWETYIHQRCLLRAAPWLTRSRIPRGSIRLRHSALALCDQAPGRGERQS